MNSLLCFNVFNRLLVYVRLGAVRNSRVIYIRLNAPFDAKVSILVVVLLPDLIKALLCERGEERVVVCGTHVLELCVWVCVHNMYPTEILGYSVWKK